MNTPRNPSEPRSAMTWPETWSRVPPQCPVCDTPTVADRCLDSSHGPGWRCTLDASHYCPPCLAPRASTTPRTPAQPTRAGNNGRGHGHDRGQC